MNWLLAAAGVAAVALLGAVVNVAMTSTVAYLAITAAFATAAYFVGRPLWKP